MQDQLMTVAGDSAAVNAVRLAAGKNGFNLTVAAAKAVAEAVLNTPDRLVSVTSSVPPDMWKDTKFQDHIRDALRFDLVHAMLKEGVVAASLMQESLSYTQVGTLGNLEGRTIPADEVDMSTLTGPWWTVEITLTVAVRQLIPKSPAAAPAPAAPHPAQLMCGNGRIEDVLLHPTEDPGFVAVTHLDGAEVQLGEGDIIHSERTLFARGGICPPGTRP